MIDEDLQEEKHEEYQPHNEVEAYDDYKPQEEYQAEYQPPAEEAVIEHATPVEQATPVDEPKAEEVKQEAPKPVEKPPTKPAEPSEAELKLKEEAEKAKNKLLDEIK